MSGTPAALPPLRPYQHQVLRAVLASVLGGRGLTFSVMVSRQGGKNELSAQLELALLLLHAGHTADAVKCAPTLHPQGLVSLRRLWSRVEGCGLAGVARREGGNAVRLGRARQLFFSAAPAAAVAGHTCHLLLECDEAQDVDAETFDRVFRPMAATTNATTVYYGTAWSETDLLATVRERHLALERQDGIRRHFAVDWQEVARYNPAYATYVEGERRRLGEEHPLFTTQYLLRPLAGGGRLLSPAQRALLAGAHPRLAAPGPTEPGLLGYVAGLDVAGEALGAPPGRHGQDATVLTIARVRAAAPGALVPEPQIEVVEQAVWRGVSHADLTGGLARLLLAVWRVRRVVVDATGVGEGLAAGLAAAARGRAEVVRLRLTEERKSALGFGLLAAVNSGRLQLFRADGSAEWRALAREMELARAAYRPGRRLAWGVDPADGHDDALVSLALTVEAARELTPRVAWGSSPPD